MHFETKINLKWDINSKICSGLEAGLKRPCFVQIFGQRNILRIMHIAKHIAHYIIFTFQSGNITESTLVHIAQNHANHLQLKESITGQNICRNRLL